jgi:hypothetical protein
MIFDLTTPNQMVLKVSLSWGNKQEKEIKGLQIGKKEIKLLFLKWPDCLHGKSTKEFSQEQGRGS